ncbi:hypothetical protein DFJ77DRAFT_548722 [Powellomyces hirtus]|nr:hypothetical protein DFJ77DRAFT_548722 [Powellomyces hirtus]
MEAKTDSIGRLWLKSPEWCDWRCEIYNCRLTGTWTVLYKVSTVLTALLSILGAFLLYHKVYKGLWMKKLGIFEIVRKEGIRPRSEIFLVALTIHFITRTMYTSVILAGGFGSIAAAEVFHDIPWCLIYSGALCVTVSLIYACPVNILDDVNRRLYLPSRKALNVILIFFGILPCITLPLAAGFAGRARDIGDAARSKQGHLAHYWLWSSYCYCLSGGMAYYGFLLVNLGRNSVRSLKNSSTSGQARCSETNSSTPGQARCSVMTHDSKRARRQMRLSITSLLITVCAVVAAGFLCGVVMTTYAHARNHVISIPALSVIFACTWLFILPVTLGPVFAAAIYNVLSMVGTKDQSEENPTTTMGTHRGARKMLKPRFMSSVLSMVLGEAKEPNIDSGLPSPTMVTAPLMDSFLDPAETSTQPLPGRKPSVVFVNTEDRPI